VQKLKENGDNQLKNIGITSVHIVGVKKT